jgi:hypothetical protein
VGVTGGLTSVNVAELSALLKTSSVIVGEPVMELMPRMKALSPPVVRFTGPRPKASVEPSLSLPSHVTTAEPFAPAPSVKENAPKLTPADTLPLVTVTAKSRSVPRMAPLSTVELPAPVMVA